MHLSIRGCPSAERPPLRNSRYCRKTIYSGRLPPAIPGNGVDWVYESSTTFQQTFHGISTSATAGAKALHPLPSEQNAAKRHFTENERPDILNRMVPCQVYRTNVRQAAKNPSAHRRKQSLSFRKQTIPPPLLAVCNHFTVAPL